MQATCQTFLGDYMLLDFLHISLCPEAKNLSAFWCIYLFIVSTKWNMWSWCKWQYCSFNLTQDKTKRRNPLSISLSQKNCLLQSAYVSLENLLGFCFKIFFQINDGFVCQRDVQQKSWHVCKWNLLTLIEKWHVPLKQSG